MNFEKINIIQITITIVASLFLLIHIMFPHLSIDGATLTLLVIAILPWLAPLFKSIEIPGGWKFEFQARLDKEKEKLEKAGLLSKLPTKKLSFMPLPDEDPNIALTWLRIEIEKRLRALAEKNGIIVKAGAGKLLRELFEKNIIDSQDMSILADLIGTLNPAAHGYKVNSKASEWAFNVGPRLLETLDQKYNLSKK